MKQNDKLRDGIDEMFRFAGIKELQEKQEIEEETAANDFLLMLIV